MRGPNGANDEFIEIYNNSGADHTVARRRHRLRRRGLERRRAVRASPTARSSPTRGHYLVREQRRLLARALPGRQRHDRDRRRDLHDRHPRQRRHRDLQHQRRGATSSLANRLDAVGSTSEANTLYKEGTGYPALTPFSIDYAFYRDDCGKSGSITTIGPCTISTPKDTNNNAADFIFVDTNGTSAGAGQRLGAPGPENLSSPDPAQRRVRRRACSTRASASRLAAEPRPRLHQRPGEQLDVRHARHPPHVHQQHRRQRHPACASGSST